MKYEGTGTLSVRQPDGTWRVVGTVNSVAVRDEIGRRMLRDGEVIVDLQRGQFVDVEMTVEVLNAERDRINKLQTIGTSVPGPIPLLTASKRTAPPWKRRHYGPQR